MHELGLGMGKEYTSDDGEENVFLNIRRTITRFVGTVCIALVLEALIMIIKYSQFDLAGNLYYPVAIIVDRKSTRLNSSHVRISYAVFCLKKKKKTKKTILH